MTEGNPRNPAPPKFSEPRRGGRIVHYFLVSRFVSPLRGYCFASLALLAPRPSVPRLLHNVCCANCFGLQLSAVPRSLALRMLAFRSLAPRLRFGLQSLGSDPCSSCWGHCPLTFWEDVAKIPGFRGLNSLRCRLLIGLVSALVGFFFNSGFGCRSALLLLTTPPAAAPLAAWRGYLQGCDPLQGDAHAGRVGLGPGVRRAPVAHEQQLVRAFLYERY